MAIQPLTLYNSAFEGLFDGTIGWVSETNVAAVLCESDYGPSLTHSTYADLTHEVDDEGDYDPQKVDNRSIARVDDEVQFDSDPVNYGIDVTISAQYLVLVAGDPADLEGTDKLIGYVDFGETKSSTSAPFTFTPADSGWFRVSRTP